MTRIPQMCAQRIVLFGVLMSVCRSGVLVAQRQETEQQVGTQQTPDSVVTPPRPIPISQIIPRAESLRVALGILEPAGLPDARISAIDSLLPQSAEAVAALAAESDSVALRTASTRILDDLRNRWSRRGSQLSQWQRTVDQRSRRLDSIATQLRDTRIVWQITNDSAVAGDLPEAVRDRMAEVFRTLDSAEARIHARIDTVLTVASQVSQQQATVTEALLRLEAAETARRQQLLSPDHPPLWRAFGQRDTTMTVRLGIRGSWQRDLDVLMTFVREERGVLVLRLVLFGLVALGLAVLGRRSVALAGEDQAVSRAVAVLGRPIAASFLLFLLSGRLFHAAMPQVFIDLNALLLVVPLARMIPVVVPRDARSVAYGLVGLYFAQEIDAFFVSESVFHRLVSLGGTLLVLVGLIWLVRPTGLSARSHRNRWWSAFLLYVRIGIVILAGALVASIVGMVGLAEFLTAGVLTGLIVAFLLVAGAVVISATIHVLLQSEYARGSAVIRQNQRLLADRLDGIISLAALVSWLWITLALFRVRDIVVGWVIAVRDGSLSVGSIDISVGDVIAFAFVIWISFQISKFIRFVLREEILPRVDLPRGVPRAITTLTNYFVMFVGFLFAAAAAGFNLSQVTLLAGAFGVGIGFGLQNIVSNFVSGLILIFERPIRSGDIIQVDTLLGTVKQIGIRASVVRTFDGAEVIVPNADFVSGRVINWSLSDKLRRIELTVGVAYGTDPQKVLDLLVQVAQQHERVLHEPTPSARFLGFGDSSLDFSLWAWCNLDEWFAVTSDLNVKVNAALAEADIEIPFPQRDLHVRSIDAKAVRAARSGDNVDVRRSSASQPSSD